MLEQLSKTIKTTDTNTDFWLSNESCNKLIEEAESIRITEAGIFELKFNSGDTVGIKTAGLLLYGESETAYVKLLYLNAEFKADSYAEKCKVL